MLATVDELREFMFSRVYTDSAAKEDDPKTHFVVHQLFDYFCEHPDELPEEMRGNPRNEPVERRVADYIAGMTDRYAIQVFERYFRAGALGGPFVVWSSAYPRRAIPLIAQRVSSVTEEIRARVDLVELIGRSVAAANAPAPSSEGLCPFHTEKTPSFYVRPQTQYVPLLRLQQERVARSTG